MQPAWWKKLAAAGRLWGSGTLKPLGVRGEAAAVKHLRRSGYRILARNLRNRLGEIDILAEDLATQCIAIVEVKATAAEHPPPEMHVNPAKRRKLTALAGRLIQRHRLHDRTIRFDVIGIVWPAEAKQPTRLTHHVNAFEANG